MLMSPCLGASRSGPRSDTSSAEQQLAQNLNTVFLSRCQSRKAPLRPPPQHRHTRRERLLAGGERKAEVAVTLGKNTSRDNQEVVLDGCRDKLLVRPPRHTGKEVERTFGPSHLVAIGQALVDEVALGPIVAANLLDGQF